MVVRRKNLGEQTMAESTYHQMSVQHIKYLEQSNSPVPVALVHQQVLAQQVRDTERCRHQQALEAVQDLERQRLDHTMQDQVGERPQPQQQ
jgi:hypothetical protein